MQSIAFDLQMRALSGKYYTSNEIFSLEMQRIFSKRWLYTVHESALPQPGSHVLFEPVPGESVMLMRGDDGQIRGFYNVCRHRGARLRSSDGQLPGSCLRCPYHAWTYGLDGQLLGAPHMADVPGFNRAEISLVAVPTAVWEGLVFINLDPAAMPLEQALAPILNVAAPWQIPRLVLADQITYDVAANWKLISQNDAECYHCPLVHPRLTQLSPTDLDTDVAYPNLESGEILGGPMRIERPNGSLTESGNICAPPLVSEPERSQAHYYMLFPTLSLSLLPDYVLIHRLDPLAVDRTRIVVEWLVDPAYLDSTEFDPQEAVAFWDRVNREDWHICERAQQGVRSRGFMPGLYSELESLTAAFDVAYLQAINARG
jgi:Rieske 2Fe-2S family protein